MAQYKINYACGHEEIVQLYGKISEREYRISRMEKQLCPECWKKQQAEKAKKQTVSAMGRRPGEPPLPCRAGGGA